ncbi:MAG TPA: polysaccharide deacetylase family protein [Methanomassiliicoccales archaeon]|jgi:peptidoglycan/xylan/chitin deacetylase (PgdA/CDA1 family)
MRRAAITVDVDRDVNQACKGRMAAISSPVNGSDEPRFSSSRKGLELIVATLNDLDVRGTFFFEATTALEINKTSDIGELMQGHEIACHAYDHEDLTGIDTGMQMDREDIDDILERSVGVLDTLFGEGRRGFRAPYLHSSEELMSSLKEHRFLYDSSVVEEIRDGSIRPYLTKNGLPEVPIASSRDQRGKKIVGYLWPFHEGKRPIGDYLRMVDGFRDGLLVLSTHSWHPVENFCNGQQCELDVQKGMDDLRELIQHSVATGVEFVTVAEHVDRCMGGSC